MTVTISFPNLARFIGNRPYTDICLNPKSGHSPTYKCLVDTGADYLQLPALAATASGLSLNGAVHLPVSTAGGATNLCLLTAIQLEIEGQFVIVDALFDPTNMTPPIAGRGVLLAAFELGLRAGDWLWR